MFNFLWCPPHLQRAEVVDKDPAVTQESQPLFLAYAEQKQ